MYHFLFYIFYPLEVFEATDLQGQVAFFTQNFHHGFLPHSLAHAVSCPTLLEEEGRFFSYLDVSLSEIFFSLAIAVWLNLHDTVFLAFLLQQGFP